MSPLLSIVVPSKNRYYYLEFLVQYFHSIESDKIELVIQDNSDISTNQDFINFLNKLNDFRIIYSYTSEELSVVENCDLAIEKASGEYITLIGDDDIFSKYLIEFIEKCKFKSIDAILPNIGSYSWPDVHARFYKDKLSGIYRLNSVSGKIKTLDVKNILNKVIKIGGTNILNLPRVYHGIIKKSVLEKVFEDSGSYFPGPSPDMANAIALCKFITNYVSIDMPLIISGHSMSSTGGQGAQGQHFGEVSKIKHLPKDTASNWSLCIPFYWSGYTIYGESVLQALKRMDMDEYLNDFNYDYLYAACLVFDFQYKERILKAINNKYGNSNIYKLIKVYFYFCIIWINRLLYHFKKNLVLIFPDIIKKNNEKIYKKQNILEIALLNDELIKERVDSILSGII